MDSVGKDIILQFNEDTLQSVRKDFNFDISEKINKAIDTLEEWIKKQDYFMRKQYDREYLEKIIIISCKGSVERAKIRLDRICTLRTLMPKLYEPINFKTDYKDSNCMMGAFLPKLTDDHYRVYMVKCIGNRFDNRLTNYYRFLISLAEYMWAHDYSKGVIFVLDYLDCDLSAHIKQLNITEARQITTLFIEGYGLSVKEIHIVTSSKTVEMLVSMCKIVLSAKIFARIKIHKDLESLHKVLSKDILPIEQGGNEKSLRILHEEWLSVLSSSEHQEYFNKMREAVTNEKYRQTGKLNSDYMGIEGTFRNLNVD